MNLKTFIITLLGVIVQYYDYHMLSLLASVVSKYFFPDFDILMRTFYTYLLITVSYSAKPLGAFFLGKIGDIYGRSSIINISLLGTAIGSLCISLIPGYNIIGFLSIILLLICRMFIAAFVSSGTDGIRLFVFEKISKKNQCFGIGLVSSSTMIGILIASISVNYFTAPGMPDWYWRITFAIGAFFGIAIVLVRKFLLKDSENYVAKEIGYEEFKNKGSLEIIKDNSRLFILCILLAGTIGSFNQFYIIFFGHFCSDILKIVNKVDMGHYRSIALLIYIFSSIFGGYIADKFGKKLINQIGGGGLITVGLLLIYMLINNQFNLTLYLAGAFLLPIVVVPSLVILKESVPIVIRYRVFSFAHAIGSIFISAPTSALSVYLYKTTNISWTPIIYFILIITILMVTVTLISRKPKY